MSMYKVFLQCCMAAALGFSQAQAQTPEFFFMVKDAWWWQSQPNEVTFNNANAEAGIEGVLEGSINNPRVILPGGQSVSMAYKAQDMGYFAESEDYGSTAELNAAFANGLYRINGTGTTGLGAFDVHLNLAGTFPEPPLITNFAQLQESDPSSELTLMWSPFNTATGAPHRFVQVFGHSLHGDHRFESDLLPADTTFITIQPGTFPHGSEVQFEVAFIAASQFDEGGGPAASTTAAAYISTTEFRFPGQIQPVDQAVAFFADDLYVFDGSQPGTSQWYFSFTFKDIFHFVGNNWFFFEQFNAYLWVALNSGSLADGFWSYTMFPGFNHATWIYMARDGNFYDLRDPGHTGVNTLPDSAAGAQTLDGYIFMQQPMPGDPAGPAWYYFSEFADGNYLLNLNIDNPDATDWHLLRPAD